MPEDIILLIPTAAPVNLLIQESPPVNFVFGGAYLVSYIRNLTVQNGDTYDVPAGKLLLALVVLPDDGGDRTLSAGYANGDTDLLDNEEIPAGQSYAYSRPTYYHETTTIHFSGDAAAIKLYLL